MTWRRRAVRGLAVALLCAAGAIAQQAATADAAVRFDSYSAIKIPLKGNASPYPSTINVQGQGGRIAYVGVQLRKVAHTRISDLDIILEAPNGTRSVVMSDVCNGIAQTPISSLVFSASVTESMPVNGPCAGGLYRPTEYAASDGVANFDAFIGGDPNGVWKLYVVDDQTGYLGEIAGGWSLTLESVTPDVTVPGNATGIGAANPYPATRNVAGLGGVITDLNVSLSGIFHTRPDDLDLVLVGPYGQKVTLMSDACGEAGVKSANWGWDDEAAAQMPDAAFCPTNQSFVPTDRDTDELMPAPLAPGPYEKRLSAFDFTEPDGTWQLYAADDLINASGFFRQRFELQIATRAPAELSFTNRGYSLTEGQTRELTITRSSGGQGLGPARIRVASQPVEASEGTDYRPIDTVVEFAPGQASRTISVQALTDGTREEPENFLLAIGQPSGDAFPTPPASAIVTVREPGEPGRDLPGGTGGGGGNGAGGSGGSGGAGGANGPDTNNGPIGRGAPVLTGLALTPNRFPVTRRGRVNRARRGTTIRWRLSESGTVALAFERVLPGRRVGRACRAATSRNRRGRPCVRYVPVGTLGVPGRVGANRLAFSGVIGDRRLRRGAHRVRVTATDAAGNRSARTTRTFRVTG